MWILKVAETLNVTSFCFFFFSFFVRDDFEKWKGVDGGMSRENVVTKSFLSFFFFRTIGGGVSFSGQHLLEIE